MKAHVATGIAAVNNEGTPNPEAKYYLCGAEIQFYHWHFMSPTHAILALKKGTGIDPCRRCLRVMLKVLTDELGISTHKSEPVPERTKRNV